MLTKLHILIINNAVNDFVKIQKHGEFYTFTCIINLYSMTFEKYGD